jgi:alkaline phosphatase D
MTRKSNPVVIASGLQPNLANELIADFDPLDSQGVATEFVGTSITSGGNGTATLASSDQLCVENPVVKFFGAGRGYVRCEVTPRP